jgi:hypothetical protein
MTDEAVNELTERVAAMTETIAAGGAVNMTEFRLAVLEVCQAAQGGAGIRPVPGHFIPASWSAMPTGAAIVWPIYSSEGVALRLDYQLPPLQRDHPEDIGVVNLGMDGGLVLAHELQAAAALQAGLAARQRAN